jgi:malate synthase
MSLNLPAGIQDQLGRSIPDYANHSYPEAHWRWSPSCIAPSKPPPGVAEGPRRPPGAHRCRRNARLSCPKPAIREGDWKIAPLPKALERRRTEITGPVEAKMIINAFNSGADSYMTDFEDSNSPKWDNQIQGQVNLYKAIRRELSFKNETARNTSSTTRSPRCRFVRAAGTSTKST